jgi:hypothetical protein|tara:strand:- start:160 stop:381 length:222 start_codon:yes stop_codon:yes gene_type:complete
MKPEWNWMLDRKNWHHEITPCSKCKENAWYALTSSNYLLCLKCGNQEECKTASELEKKLSKDRVNLEGLGEEE